uniref:AP-2 complex subunit alpha-1 n=1 Tax=Rhizophora mucronata TaxID=61149 RepID=A0A2P2MSW0_RHIMU
MMSLCSQPAFLGTSEQILKKQLPYDQNPHHNPAYKYKAFSRHISSFHKDLDPSRS